MVCGSLVLKTKQPAIELVGPVLAKLAYELSYESAGSISTSATSVSFNRGYPAARYSTSIVASFNPGQISVGGEGGVISIRYRLGLMPFYTAAALSGLAVLVSLLVVGLHPTALWLCALIVIVLGGGLAYNLLRFRSWVQRVAQAAINAGSAEEI